jgi:hypothetical protein
VFLSGFCDFYLKVGQIGPCDPILKLYNIIECGGSISAIKDAIGRFIGELILKFWLSRAEMFFFVNDPLYVEGSLGSREDTNEVDAFLPDGIWKRAFWNATENLERVDERKSLLRHTLTKFHLSSYHWEPL